MKTKIKLGILLHKSAARLRKTDEVLFFPSFETIIFVTVLPFDTFVVSECFTHTDDGTLKPFFFDGRDLIFGDPKDEKENSIFMGILLYASGLNALVPYLKYLMKKVKKDAEFVLIPAAGGRLEGVRRMMEAAK